MAYIGKQPAVAALTTSDLADNIVTSAKISNGTITATDMDLSGTYAFTGTVTGAGATAETLDIGSLTDYSTNDITDTDLFMADFRASGTNRKLVASKFTDYIGLGYKSVGTWTDLTTGTQVNYDSIANSTGVILIRNQTRNHKSPIPFYSRGGGGIGFYFVFLDPDNQTWTSSTSFSFSEEGADVNTYTVSHTTGGGVLSVTRTAGSQAYDVQIYKINYGHSL